MKEESGLSLDEVLREGARLLLQAAVLAEADDYVERHSHLLDAESGRRLVVRNGYQ